MIVDPNTLAPRDRYKFAIGTVVPRPIAWVSTISEDGVANVAPFSYFTIVSVNPFIMMFAPQRRPDGSKKDTWRNVEAIGDFVVNLTNEQTAEAMNRTATDLPANQSEFEYAGLTAAASETIQSPRIAEAPVSYECKLHSITTFSDETGGAAVFGAVTCIHVRDDIYVDGYISLEAFKPIGRLAGNEYSRVTDRFTLVRDRS